MAVVKKVLYADDDPDDRSWFAEACQLLGIPVDLCFADNGKQVLHYLAEQPETNLPQLIVLDLNMPDVDGRQTLQRLKASAQWAHIPVAVMSTATNRIDSQVCNRLGAAIYLTKPATYAAWQNLLQQLMPLLEEAPQASANKGR